MRTFITATIMGAASLALVGAASAQVVVPKDQEFYATPIAKGAPTDLPGERLVPGASQTAVLLDGILGPIVVVPTQQLGTNVGGGVGPIIAGIPILGDGAVAPAPAAAGPAPRVRRHHRRLSRRALSRKAQHIE